VVVILYLVFFSLGHVKVEQKKRASHLKEKQTNLRESAPKVQKGKQNQPRREVEIVKRDVHQLRAVVRHQAQDQVQVHQVAHQAVRVVALQIPQVLEVLLVQALQVIVEEILEGKKGRKVERKRSNQLTNEDQLTKM